MFILGWFCLLPATITYLHQVLYPLLNPYIPYAFLKSAPRFLPKARGRHVISIPVRNISVGTCFSSIHLYSMQNVRDGMLTGQKPGTRNCAIPVLRLSVLRSAHGQTPTPQTLTGKSAAARSVCYVEVTRSPTGVRLHCFLGSNRVEMKGR